MGLSSVNASSIIRNSAKEACKLAVKWLGRNITTLVVGTIVCVMTYRLIKINRVLRKQLESKIQSNETDIKKLKEQIQNQSSGSKKEEIDEPKVNRQIEELQQKLESYQKQQLEEMTQLSTKFDSFTNARFEKAVEVVAKDSSKEGKEKRDELKLLFQEKSADIASLSSKVTQLKMELTGYTGDCHGKIAKNTKDIADLKKLVSGLNKGIEELHTALQKVSDEVKKQTEETEKTNSKYKDQFRAQDKVNQLTYDNFAKIKVSQKAFQESMQNLATDVDDLEAQMHNRISELGVTIYSDIHKMKSEIVNLEDVQQEVSDKMTKCEGELSGAGQLQSSEKKRHKRTSSTFSNLSEILGAWDKEEPESDSKDVSQKVTPHASPEKGSLKATPKASPLQESPMPRISEASKEEEEEEK